MKRTPPDYVKHIIDRVDVRARLEAGVALSAHSIALIRLFFWVRDAMAEHPAPPYLE